MNSNNVFFFEDASSVKGDGSNFTDFPWPALRGIPEEERDELLPLLVPYAVPDGDLFQGPGKPPPGLFFLRGGRVSVAARLPNGLYAEPIAAGAGVTLGEAGWPKVRTPQQRIWATSGAVGWLLPKVI